MARAGGGVHIYATDSTDDAPTPEAYRANANSSVHTSDIAVDVAYTVPFPELRELEQDLPDHGATPWRRACVEGRQVVLDKAEGDVGITVVDSPDGVGVIVSALQASGLAELAGLLVGDVLLSVNGAPVNSHQEAIALVDRADVFVPVVVVARRGTHQLALDKSSGRVGITCIDNPRGRGVVVQGLVADSIAPAAGLHVGDVLLSVGGVLVNSHAEAVRQVRHVVRLTAPVRGACAAGQQLTQQQAGLGAACAAKAGGEEVRGV